MPFWRAWLAAYPAWQHASVGAKILFSMESMACLWSLKIIRTWHRHFLPCYVIRGWPKSMGRLPTERLIGTIHLNELWIGM